MAQRVRAPGPDSAALREVLARMRAIGREVRKVEVQLASQPASAHAPLVRRLNLLFAQREDSMARWVEETLPRVAASGARYAAVTLSVPFRVTAALRAHIQALQVQTFTEVAASTQFLRADTIRLLRQVVAETTTLQLTHGISIDEARRLLTHRMEGIGVRAFIDRSGRAWKIDTYSEMLARTRSAHAYNVGTVIHSRQYGIDVFEIFDGTEDEICSVANGKIVPGSFAMSNPTGHPNCQRAFGPVTPEEARGAEDFAE